MNGISELPLPGITVRRVDVYIHFMECPHEYGGKIVWLSIVTDVQTDLHKGTAHATETVRVEHDSSETNMGIIRVVIQSNIRALWNGGESWVYI